MDPLREEGLHDGGFLFAADDRVAEQPFQIRRTIEAFLNHRDVFIDAIHRLFLGCIFV
jgi:hypothetical protein